MAVVVGPELEAVMSSAVQLRHGESHGIAPHPSLGSEQLPDKVGSTTICSSDVEMLDKLAQVLVNDMMRLELAHGLRPVQMVEYYKGRLTLDQYRGDKT